MLARILPSLLIAADVSSHDDSMANIVGIGGQRKERLRTLNGGLEN
jgi:hypothetical protein